MLLMKSSRTHHLGAAALLSATFIYGLFGVTSRIIGYSIPLFYQTGIKTLVAAIVLCILTFSHRQWKKLTPPAFFWIFMRSLAGVLVTVSFFVAVNKLAMGTVYFIFYAGSTIGGYAIGYVLFAEKITRIKMLSLFLALVGLGLIYSLSIDEGKIFYALVSLLAGISGSIWNTFSKKIPEEYAASQLSFLDNSFEVVIALLISLFLGETWQFPRINAAWSANILTGLGYVLTGQLMIYGFRKMDVQIGSLILLAEIMFGALFGFMFYQETLSIMAAFGGICIISAIILPQLQKSHELV